MKRILLLLLLISTFAAKAQFGSKNYGTWTWTFDSTRTYTIWSDKFSIDLKGNIKITGDSLSAFKLLISEWEAINTARQRTDSLNIELLKLANAAVMFANEVPDHWKLNNCKWPKYNKLLNQNGYKSTKRKQKGGCN